MARPRTEIDLDQLTNLARIHCTAEECAAFFQCSVDTIDRRLKEAGEGGFAVFHERHAVEGKASLRRAQFQLAQAGHPTMLIWLGKQWLGQRDGRDVPRDDDAPAPPLTITLVAAPALGEMRVTRPSEVLTVDRDDAP